MRFYPEEPGPGVPVSEVWHAQKWHRGMALEHLTPMYAAAERHFYVNELARDVNSNLFIPLRWVIRQGELCADAYRVTQMGSGHGHITVSISLQFTRCNKF